MFIFSNYLVSTQTQNSNFFNVGYFVTNEVSQISSN